MVEDKNLRMFSLYRFAVLRALEFLNMIYSDDIFIDMKESLKNIMFSPLSVCLFVCEHDVSKSYGRIRLKLGGQVGCVTRMN